MTTFIFEVLFFITLCPLFDGSHLNGFEIYKVGCISISEWVSTYIFHSFRATQHKMSSLTLTDNVFGHILHSSDGMQDVPGILGNNKLFCWPQSEKVPCLRDRLIIDLTLTKLCCILLSTYAASQQSQLHLDGYEAL